MKAFGNYSEPLRYNKMTSVLVAAQTWRVVGIALLWGMTQGILRPTFAIPAGVGDILVGATAIPFAIFLWRGHSWSKSALIVWSVLGITDLVYAVSLGVMINPDLGNSIITTFPWILFPAVFVPTALALDVIVLYRLRNWMPKQESNKSWMK